VADDFDFKDILYCAKWTRTAERLGSFGLINLNGLEKSLHGNKCYNPEEIKLRLLQSLGVLLAYALTVGLAGWGLFALFW